ncbi:MAG: hypothetical protein JEZ06_23930 [Anaerolineaceae bacterium]|nr:hypothetical protein [Anaerolineaceae bacterium]
MQLRAGQLLPRMGLAGSYNYLNLPGLSLTQEKPLSCGSGQGNSSPVWVWRVHTIILI